MRRTNEMKTLVAAALVAGLGCTSEKAACREAEPVTVGRVLYVSPTGSPAGDFTAERPGRLGAVNGFLRQNAKTLPLTNTLILAEGVYEGRVEVGAANDPKKGKLFIRSANGAPHLCVIRASKPGERGLVYEGAVEVSGVTVDGFTTDKPGPIAVVSNGSATAPVFRNCVFSNNRAKTSPVFGQTGWFFDCLFMNNRAEKGPGALQTSCGTFVGCRFLGNVAERGDCGAVSGSGAFTNCVFEANGAPNGLYGAGSFANGNWGKWPSHVVNCRFTGNFAERRATTRSDYAAVFSLGKGRGPENCVFEGNRCPDVGAADGRGQQEWRVAPGCNLRRLRDEIRAKRRADGSRVTVTFADGVYAFTNGVELTEKDRNITFRAQNPGKVTFVSGFAARGGDAKPLDAASPIAKRLPEGAAAQVRVLKVPDGIATLFASNVTGSVTMGAEDDFSLTDHSGLTQKGTHGPMFSVDSHLMWHARWPNDGVFHTVTKENYVHGDSIPKVVNGVPVTNANGKAEMVAANNVIRLPNARAKNWNLTDRPAFAYGFIMGGCPYANTSKRLLGFTNEGDLEIAKGWGAVVPGGRMWFMNILEELDAPGEWCFEPSLGSILFIPPKDGLKADSVLAVGHVRESLFDITGSGISIEGIDFTGKIAYPVVRIDQGRGNRVLGCRFRGLDRYAMWVGGRDSLVQSCDFSEIVDTGICLRGGDANSGDWGNNAVDNCHFSYCCLRREGWAAGGVTVAGARNRVSHCEIHDFIEQGLVCKGVGHLVEYNHVYNTASEFGDGSAVYCGGLDNYGNVFRYNDIGSAPGYVNGLYLDDMSSGNEVYGNIFRNFGYYGVFLGGGRDNVISNNIITAGWGGIHLDNRGLTWPAWKNAQTAYDNLRKKYRFTEGPLAEAYPGWAAYDPTDKFCFGYVNNVFDRNLFVDLSGYATTIQIVMKKTKAVPQERYSWGDNLVVRTKGLTGMYDMERPETIPTNQYSACSLAFDPIGKARVLNGTAGNPIDLGFRQLPPAAFKSEEYMLVQQGWIDAPKLAEIRASGKFRGVVYPKGDFGLTDGGKRLAEVLPGFQPIPFDKIGLYKDEWRK